MIIMFIFRPVHFMFFPLIVLNVQLFDKKEDVSKSGTSSLSSPSPPDRLGHGVEKGPGNRLRDFNGFDLVLGPYHKNQR